MSRICQECGKEIGFDPTDTWDAPWPEDPAICRECGVDKCLQTAEGKMEAEAVYKNIQGVAAHNGTVADLAGMSGTVNGGVQIIHQHAAESPKMVYDRGGEDSTTVAGRVSRDFRDYAKGIARQKGIRLSDMLREMLELSLSYEPYQRELRLYFPQVRELILDLNQSDGKPPLPKRKPPKKKRKNGKRKR